MNEVADEKVSSTSLVTELADGLQPGFENLGFKRVGVHKFVRKRVGVEHVFLLLWRVQKGWGTKMVFVTPVVQTNFPEVKRLVKAIRGPSLLPCVGGALGRFTPKQSLIEWRLDSRNTTQSVAPDIWSQIERWAVAFWDSTPSIAEVLNAIEAGRMPDKPPYWEDLAVMHYLARDFDSAVRFLRGLTLTDHEVTIREKAIEVLGAHSGSGRVPPKMT